MTMIRELRALAVASGMLLTAAPAVAHHGTSVNYDFSRTITIVGTVTEFRWRNPHSALFVDVTNEDGTVTSYAIELPSPTLMSRGELGWTRHTFKPGDHVEFDAHPSRTGAPVAVGGCTDGCRVLVNGEPPKKEY
jgi:DNA/RNA endonuclease YhcR with UshA esterase domain